MLGLSTKDDGYRKAGRALLLIELLYDDHGNGPVENFLAQRRETILEYLTEERLQNAIQVKLNALPHIVVNGLVYRSYDDRNSETVDFHAPPHVQGIFSTGALGGCIVVALLYGGKKGQPLKAASLVHVNNIGGSELENRETASHGVDRWGNFGRAFAPTGRTSDNYIHTGTYVIG